MKTLETLTLKSVIEHSAEVFVGRQAMTMVNGEPLTYQAFFNQVQKLSAFLHDQGIITGDRVALLSENRPQWGVAYFAITTMGAVVVPILPEFRANEVNHILRHAGCKAVIISNRQLEKLDDSQFDRLNAIMMVEDFSLAPRPQGKDRLKEVVLEGSKELAKFREAALRFTGFIPPEVREDDLASIIYTSGTTGHSKGVMLTHKNIVFDALATLKIQSVTETDRLLSILPLSHAYECTLGMVIPLIAGACVYYLDKPPTARVLLPAMAQVKPTMMLTVPLVIEKIYKMQILPKFTRKAFIRALYHLKPIRRKLHRIAGKKLYASFGGALHFFGIGGAALAPEVEQFLRDAKFPYAIGYGLTETSPIIAGCSPDKTRFRSTGPVIPGVEIKIDNPHPQTGEGEILARGPIIMRGYYNDPERTVSVMTPDGWFRTGDLGVLDADGYLYIKGRLKNMILGPSGENIYPEEIETVINEFDYVLESLVFEHEHQMYARVHLNYEALDQTFGDSKLSEFQLQKHIQELLENLRTQVNQRVPNFARIKKIIEQSEPFEKTPTQK
ncbi:AMP-binding protein, partial [candidate division KSB1 bacterium]|nr:AMP-binding protein [candidate division KSB1 bacterium]